MEGGEFGKRRLNTVKGKMGPSNNNGITGWEGAGFGIERIKKQQEARHSEKGGEAPGGGREQRRQERCAGKHQPGPVKDGASGCELPLKEEGVGEDGCGKKVGQTRKGKNRGRERPGRRTMPAPPSHQQKGV